MIVDQKIENMWHVSLYPSSALIITIINTTKIKSNKYSTSYNLILNTKSVLFYVVYIFAKT